MCHLGFWGRAWDPHFSVPTHTFLGDCQVLHIWALKTPHFPGWDVQALLGWEKPCLPEEFHLHRSISNSRRDTLQFRQVQLIIYIWDQDENSIPRLPCSIKLPTLLTLHCRKNTGFRDYKLKCCSLPLVDPKEKSLALLQSLSSDLFRQNVHQASFIKLQGSLHLEVGCRLWLYQRDWPPLSSRTLNDCQCLLNGSLRCVIPALSIRRCLCSTQGHKYYL